MAKKKAATPKKKVKRKAVKQTVTRRGAGGGAAGKRGKTIPLGLKIQFKRMVSQGYTQAELEAKYKDQMTYRQIRELRQECRNELNRELAKVGQDRINELVSLATTTLKYACVSMNKIYESGGTETVVKHRRSTKGDKVIETTETIEQPSRTLMPCMAQVFKGIDLLAKITGIYRPDFDAQGGMALNILDIPVSSEADIEAYEKAIEDQGIQGFLEQKKQVESEGEVE